MCKGISTQNFVPVVYQDRRRGEGKAIYPMDKLIFCLGRVKLLMPSFEAGLENLAPNSENLPSSLRAF